MIKQTNTGAWERIAEDRDTSYGTHSKENKKKKKKRNKSEKEKIDNERQAKENMSEMKEEKTKLGKTALLPWLDVKIYLLQHDNYFTLSESWNKLAFILQILVVFGSTFCDRFQQ